MNVLTENEIARPWTANTQLQNDAIDTEQLEWWRLARTITCVALGTAMRRTCADFKLLIWPWRFAAASPASSTVRATQWARLQAVYQER
jgi:hypothetical protein